MQSLKPSVYTNVDSLDFFLFFCHKEWVGNTLESKHKNKFLQFNTRREVDQNDNQKKEMKKEKIMLKKGKKISHLCPPGWLFALARGQCESWVTLDLTLVS